ncbi:hypothetical protein EAE32_03025 [Kocuria tytonicola]|uniref:Uncharacterized protein n=1 Tax=Kocuria tytonicola TaxID=2055946 RepID=A0A3L9LCT4_9MICC|nr:hypothetical protein [Kocuria tytonicola]RLY94202.1 hypothetical protein EAE32_03025 [Kocuria tytonicola]
MNPVQRPRHEHDSSEPPSQEHPREGVRHHDHVSRGTEDDRPRYGIRVPPTPAEGACPHGDTAAGHVGGPERPGHPGDPRATGDAAASGPHGVSAPGGARPAPSPQERTATTRAARRMGRGLSFTVILLGLLVGLGLVAADVWFGWVLGVVLVVLGVLGYAVVQTGALPVFQDPGGTARRSWSKLWLIPAALLVPGLACLGMAFVVPSWLGPRVPAELLDDYILAFVVGGMTMVVGAGLGFGLVATARFTRPDDDDSPLRPTDYAERLREREDGGDYYDSDWIRRDHRP